QEIDINLDILIRGMSDALGDKEPLLSEEEINKVLTNFQRERIAKQAQQRKQAAEENMKKSEAFLAENKAKEGVKTLESGLQYKVVTPGEGEPPKATDKVTVHYKGTLIDGTEFDSSYQRGKPASFAVNRVIKGWTEALQLMKPGAKWQLFIPPQLAYGERGAPGKIGPNETLLFEVELLAVGDDTEAEAEKAPAEHSSDSAAAEKSADNTSDSDKAAE
ncbi:MAG: FKBP-type peptidyl-prolyl cis-trans isomerase, partial [Pseudomonadota bacterium]|nr:FKBP-type peptidyl-prolyl cis-trans isomerase [Pseudomonadota bacterium]